MEKSGQKIEAVPFVVPEGYDRELFKAAYMRCVVPEGYDPHSFRTAFAEGAMPPHGDDSYGYRGARHAAKRLTDTS